ncbi:MAG: sulfurtransferase, partial [Cyclobacteriaceae bacterium]|nr:sulfurtransferase [Cyclobacteriaceae bacterium]
MGPLVPSIISDEFDLIIAIILGFGFGFILEQAGFSSSKKLVGLFYGYNFVVLKVFFTAGITAMIGVLAFSHFGLLDISLIYVNPTFLKSAIVGGLVMGVG